jgi:hypothetical protein
MWLCHRRAEGKTHVPIIFKPLLGPLEQKQERNTRLFADPKFRGEYASLLETLRSLEVEGGRGLSFMLLHWAGWDEPESSVAIAERTAAVMAKKGWAHDAAEQLSLAIAIRAVHALCQKWGLPTTVGTSIGLAYKHWLKYGGDGEFVATHTWGVSLDPPSAKTRDDMFCAGTLLGDLLIVLMADATDEVRQAAAARLLKQSVTQRAIFHPNRWEKLRIPFAEYRGARSFEEAWQDLCLAHLVDACGGMPSRLPLKDVFAEIRRKLRVAIEKELLGRTQDSGDPVEKLRADQGEATPDEILRLADERLDVLMALQRLPEADAGLLKLYHDPDIDRKQLASDLGMTYVNLRQRARRIGQAAKELLA